MVRGEICESISHYIILHYIILCDEDSQAKEKVKRSVKRGSSGYGWMGGWVKTRDWCDVVGRDGNQWDGVGWDGGVGRVSRV